MTTNGTTTFVWDDENRLVEVRRNGETIQQNHYDGLGRRREKIEAAITHRYIYKDWLVLAITDGAENLLETYTHGADLSGHLGGGAGGIGGILSSTQNSTPAYYHYDFNGNIIQVTSAAQTPITQLTYTPFGEVLLKEGPFTPRYPFSTKEYDAPTQLTYYGYRFYSPAISRWLNRDPIWEIGQPVNISNAYADRDFVKIVPVLHRECAEQTQKREAVNAHRHKYLSFWENSESIEYDFVGNNPVVEYDILGLACGSGWTDKIIKDIPGGIWDFTSCCIEHDDCYDDCKSSKSSCDDSFVSVC